MCVGIEQESLSQERLQVNFSDPTRPEIILSTTLRQSKLYGWAYFGKDADPLDARPFGCCGSSNEYLRLHCRFGGERRILSELLTDC